MKKRECIAMVLAGGKGTRLASLTRNIAKPAVPFAGQYRLIDFTLSNCYNSNIDVIGVLMPNEPFEIIDRIENIKEESYNICNIHSLAPNFPNEKNSSYKGTAHAIYCNIEFIEKFCPEHVLVLSGDHIYKMDYRKIIDFHKKKGSDATIAAIEVDWKDASRFGIINTNSEDKIEEFVEKPAEPKSNLASMGVYVFSWQKLKEYLLQDNLDPESCHDFGKNVVPKMLSNGEKMYTYKFEGYWKDVGTIESFYNAHMDLLEKPKLLELDEINWPIFSSAFRSGSTEEIILDKDRKNLIGKDCSILGNVKDTVLFSGVHICSDATVVGSVIMPGACIGPGSYIEKAIIGPNAVITAGCKVLGSYDGTFPAVISENNILTKHLIEENKPEETTIVTKLERTKLASSVRNSILTATSNKNIIKPQIKDSLSPSLQS
ncbi:NTP transferase domain-containing protein [Selenomonadales bacterium OttesenSCG-928-I06]|nr:NTP transferase domain-containing protein [Selenomonadales bacterium OttesenSCG-928-I06]